MELLGGPLVLGIAVLARYNWARFHSVFETGLSYQLAGSDLQKYSHVLFSPLYILPNLYNYLVMAPGINRNFPFLESVPGIGPSIFSFITLPDIYFNNVLTGILFSTPFVLFAGICITAFVLKKMHLTSLVSRVDDLSLFKGLIAALAGSFLFGFVPFILFFWVASHYQTDFVPSLVILSIIGFWQGYIFTTHKPDIIHKLYVAIGIILMVASIIISILLVLSAHADKFQKFNPILWESPCPAILAIIRMPSLRPQENGPSLVSLGILHKPDFRNRYNAVAHYLLITGLVVRDFLSHALAFRSIIGFVFMYAQAKVLQIGEQSQKVSRSVLVGI